MDRKAELLNELRIEREPAKGSGGGIGRGWWWVTAAVVLLAAAATVVLLVLSAEAVPVHAAVARSLDAPSAPAADHSLLDASGYVVALREATVSGKGIYKVNEVLIEEGQHVRAGQVIARLDDSNVRAALDQSRAQVLQMQAALDAARVAAADAHPTFVRNQEQLAEGLISQDAFDASRASDDAARMAVEVATQNLAVARATVQVNQRLEDDTVVRAPFDGVVTQTTAQPGEIVSPQFQGGGGIAKIVDMNSLEVDVDVNENYINRVHAGQPATITLDAYPDQVMPAHVIAIIPTADQSKGTVKVRIGFGHLDPRIVPEMGARVSFLADPADSAGSAAAHAAYAGGSVRAGAVLVPIDAVQKFDGAAADSSGYVFLIHGHTVERRAVRLGERTNDGQTILSGLAGGSSLAVGNLSALKDGARIRIEP
jgi:RND family efflux transporter MFP subunit